MDIIAYILRKNQFSTTFKSLNTICNILRSIKDHVDPSNTKGVYLISCPCGAPYVGEIGGSIKLRIQEHVANIKHIRFHSSALANHAEKTIHHICIENYKIFAKIGYYHHKKFRESIEIEKH